MRVVKEVNMSGFGAQLNWGGGRGEGREREKLHFWDDAICRDRMHGTSTFVG